jgi:exopolysaccharide production protein ExoQ
MQLRSLSLDTVAKRDILKVNSLSALGALVSGLLIFCGFVFSTYTISMPNTGMEQLRQLGLPFVLGELAFIFFAIRKGFQLESIWESCPSYVKWLVVLFLGTFGIGSAFFSQVALLSVIQNIFFLIHIVFACSIAQMIGRFGEDELTDMAKNVGIGLAIFCGMIAYAFIFHPPFSSMPDNKIIWQFAIPGFISVRLFGAFCGAIFCYFLGVLLLADEKQKIGGWHYAWITLAAGMSIWSGTRAAVVGSLVALMLVAIALRVVPKMTTALSIMGCLVVATVAAIALIPYGDPTFMLFATGDASSADNLSGGRFGYWMMIWEAYQQVPWFGAGPFASHFMLPAGEVRHVQPHNIVLQFLTSWGIFATIFALALLAIATWKAHKIGQHDRQVMPFLLMLDCLLVMSLFDGMTHFAQHLMLIMICFGVVFSCGQSARKVS